MNNEMEIETISKQDVTSEKDFFNFLRLQITDKFKDSLDGSDINDSSVHAGVMTYRLMIMCAETVESLSAGLGLMNLGEQSLEICEKARRNYRIYTDELATNTIKSLDMADDEAQLIIRRHYLRNADRDIEGVFRKLTGVPNLMDETYNCSIFEMQRLNHVIMITRKKMGELKKRIQTARDKSYYDEEDTLTKKLNMHADRLVEAERLKAKSYRYDRNIKDNMIDSIPTLKLRAEYCKLMRKKSEIYNQSDDVIGFWRNRTMAAESQLRHLQEGCPTSYETHSLAMDKEVGEELERDISAQEERDDWIQNDRSELY